MNWGAPEWGLWIWFLPVLAVLFLFAERSRARALAFLGPLIERKVGVNSRSRNRRRLVLIWLAVSLVLVALAQPQWGFRWKELKQEGLNIVVVLDTSLSMNAQDVSPSRMERAHREVMDLSELLQGGSGWSRPLFGWCVHADASHSGLQCASQYGSPIEPQDASGSRKRPWCCHS